MGDMEHYHKIQKFDRAIGFMAIGSLSVAFIGLFAKIGSQIAVLSLLVFLRFFTPFLLSLCVLIPMGTLKRAWQSSGKGNHFVRGLAAAASQYFLFYYLTRGQLFNGMVLLNTAPIFIPLISFILYRHHIGRATWISVALGLVGVICVLKPDVGLIDWFSIWGLLAGVAGALSQVLFGHNSLRDKGDINIFFLFFSASIYTLIGLLTFHLVLEPDLIEITRPVFVNGFQPYLYLLGFAFASIANQYFRGRAYTYARPGTLAPFFYLTVFFAGILGWLVFGHIPDFLAIIGMILIIFSSIIRMSFSSPREQE